MTTNFFAPRPRRILTKADEATVRAELKRRLAEIDAGEVTMLSEAEMWQQAFGDEPPPTPTDPQSRSR